MLILLLNFSTYPTDLKARKVTHYEIVPNYTLLEVEVLVVGIELNLRVVTHGFFAVFLDELDEVLIVVRLNSEWNDLVD